jgi:hypothetical protein
VEENAMEISTLLLVAFICVTIGYIAGALITTLRSEREDRGENARSSGGNIEPSANPIQAVNAGSAEREEVAQLWRDPSTGMLRADIAGETIRGGRELTETQRHRVLEIVTDMENWLSYAPPFDDSAYGVEPVSAEPFSNIGYNPSVSTAPKSIVAQIDEILQEKLVGTPFEGRDIHVKETATSGVVVWIGAENFPGIDAVPDKDVRNIIRTAVREWEMRTG